MDSIVTGFSICLGIVLCLAALCLLGVVILVIANLLEENVFGPIRLRKHNKVMAEVNVRLYQEGLERLKRKYGLIP